MSVGTETVDCVRLGAVLVITYDNPPRRYLTGRGTGLLLDAVRAGESDADVRVIVLTGTDDAFIRHYDVGDIITAGEALEAGAISEGDFEAGGFADLTDAVAALAKPVIAAINGVCMGGGFELALACDIRVAGNNVEAIGLPETRIGIFPGGGGTQRLPRVIGEAAALEFILRGRTVDAAQAAAMGLVHETVPDALERSLDIAGELAAREPDGLAAAKRLVRAALDRPVADGLRDERRTFALVLRAPGAMTAMRDFVASPDQDITS